MRPSKSRRRCRTNSGRRRATSQTRGWSTRRIIWTYYAIAFGFGLFVPALRLFDRYFVLPVFLLTCALMLGFLTRSRRQQETVWAEPRSEQPVEHARV